MLKEKIINRTSFIFLGLLAIILIIISRFSQNSLPVLSLVLQPNSDLAVLVSNGQTYQAEVEFEILDQQQAWHIKTSEDLFDQMDLFSLVNLEDKNYLEILFFYRLADRAGLITPKIYPVMLKVDNNNSQLHLLIQSWSESLVEQNQRPVNDLTFDDNKLFESFLELLIIRKKNFDPEEFANLSDLDSLACSLAHAEITPPRYFGLFFNSAKGKTEVLPWWNANLNASTDHVSLIDNFFINSNGQAKKDQCLLEILGDEQQLEQDLDWISQTQKYLRLPLSSINSEVQAKDLKKKYSQLHQQLTANTVPSFISPTKDEAMILSGSHTFTETIIIPRNTQLTILPGTTLRFMPGISLLSYSPVIAQGTQSAPILISSATSEPWGAFAVIDTNDQASKFEYVTIENAAHAVVNNTTFTGGLAVHYSDVEIRNSIFRNNHGDDGANIKYAHAIIQDNQFIDNEFDGLDLDIVTGEIKNNLFANNGNDGLDVSFNQAIIKDNIMQNNSDKCLSLGEQSLAPVTNNTLSDCIMGAAVKDLSDILFENNLIKNNQQGIAVYQKKPIFGGAIIRLKNNQFEDNQENTWIDDLSEIIYEKQ